MIRYRGYAVEDLIGRVSFAEMVYLMTRGELPHPEAARLLEAALVAAVDHGPQAPSIAAARMAISCGVGINNAMASAINMLGDVHGGAGEQCVALYNAIAARLDERPASETRLAEAVSAEIAALAERGISHVPGFGHRFHPRDPRAPRLLALVDAAARRRRGERTLRRHRPRDRSAACGRQGTAGPDEYRRRHRRGIRRARICAAALPRAVRAVALGRRAGPCLRRAGVRHPQQRTNPTAADLDLYWSAGTPLPERAGGST